MKTVEVLFIFWTLFLVTSVASAADCPKSHHAVSSTNGKVKVCVVPNDNNIFINSESDDGFFSSKTILTIGSGPEASKMAASIVQQRINAEKARVMQQLDKFLERGNHGVFPIIAETQRGDEVVGTAFQYGDIFLTALHTIHDQTQNQIFLYDSSFGKKRVSGFSPLLRNNSNSVSFYEDFVVLELEGRSNPANPQLPSNIVRKKFYYAQLHYPSEKYSQSEPSVSSSHVSAVTTDKQHLMILNPSGQDFLTSGGPVYNLENGAIVGMSICTDASGAIRALHLSLLNDYIYQALALPPLPNLVGLQYRFDYASECSPIGGRRGGGHAPGDDGR